MKRLRFVPILIALLIFVSSAIADTMYAFCRPGDYVKVREMPSSKSRTVGQLDCGDPVETDGETRRDKQGRKWTLVYGFESGEAWVCSMYLQNSPIEQERCTCHIVSNGRTAMRRSPGGKVVKWYGNGAEFTVLAMSSEWVLTKAGYIDRNCVDVSGYE